MACAPSLGPGLASHRGEAELVEVVQDVIVEVGGHGAQALDLDTLNSQRQDSGIDDDYNILTHLSTAVKLHQAKCSGEGGDCLDDKRDLHHES